MQKRAASIVVGIPAAVNNLDYLDIVGYNSAAEHIQLDFLQI